MKKIARMALRKYAGHSPAAGAVDVAMQLFPPPVLSTMMISLFFSILAICFGLLYRHRGRILARVVCQVIKWCSKEFHWSMHEIQVMPHCLLRQTTKRSHEDDWDEIVVTDWTWFNPAGFAPGSFFLHAGTARIRLKLSSVVQAWCCGTAIQIDSVIIVGLKVNLTRNSGSMLNILEAIQVFDNDETIQVRPPKSDRSANKSNGRGGGGSSSSSSSFVRVMPLPAFATSATREASGYWRPSWGPQETYVRVAPPTRLSRARALLDRWRDRSSRVGRRQSVQLHALNPPVAVTVGSEGAGAAHLEKEGAVAESEGLVEFESNGEEEREKAMRDEAGEYPIGDPRRRPRWGVPFRFDIRPLDEETASE